MLTRCECLNHVNSDESVYFWTMHLREFFKLLMSLNMNFATFLLFFKIEYFLFWINSSLVIMSTVIGV